MTNINNEENTVNIFILNILNKILVKFIQILFCS